VTRFFTFTGRRAAVVVAAAALVLTTSCSSTVREGKASSYLVIDQLTGASGAKPTEFTNTLASDVVTNGSIFEDKGQVQAHIAMRDPTTLLGPSDTNVITINRYHVDYVRADGRNAPGTDVPYGFDGAITGTIGPDGRTLTFILVRAQAKVEAPLAALSTSGGMISAIANVTFYGFDQAGNAVAVTGSMSVNFADWADPS
jgi:hypothetical protein